MKNSNTEIEAHFLEIDKAELQKKLLSLGAVDHGEDFLKEIVFYDKKLAWRKEHRFLRLRKTKRQITLTLKHFQYEKESESPDLKPNVKEIEVVINDWQKTKLLLEGTGLVAYREQEKKRHSYTLDDVVIDIDSWPAVPPYAEVEGNSMEKIKEVSEKLGFDWDKAIFRGAAFIIEHFYNIKVSSFRKFTFSEMG